MRTKLSNHTLIEHYQKFKATDKVNLYKNLKRDIYEQITSDTRFDYTFKKKNGFEKNIEDWLEDHLTIVTNSDNLIEFTFENIVVTEDEKVEFDIMARSNQENIKFAASDVYISYTTDAFGSFIVSNEKIQASKETVIENNIYTLELADESADIVKFLVNAGLEPDQLYSLTQVAEKFLHVKLDIDDIYELASLTFEGLLMTNECFFYDEETGEFIGFDKISVDDPVFPFLMPSITGFSPISVSAGTGELLTITGNLFGTTKGKVKFVNADNGTSMMEANPSDIEWDNTEIKVRVPSTQISNSPAGTGLIVVEVPGQDPVSTEDITTQSNTLSIRYAVLNARDAITGEAKIIHFPDCLDLMINYFFMTKVFHLLIH